MQWLDAEPTVASYGYETVIIPYVANSRTGKTRKYFPDFLIEFTDGKRILVEVKPSKRLAQVRVQKKLAAARQWCTAHGAALQVITEVELRGMGLL
jgi:hypothetical protein